MKLCTTTDGRRAAIRLDDGTLLAVPPIDPRIPRSGRRAIFDAVLRRQVGLAQVIAEMELEVVLGRERRVGHSAAALISETPYSAAWNEAA